MIKNDKIEIIYYFVCFLFVKGPNNDVTFGNQAGHFAIISQQNL